MKKAVSLLLITVSLFCFDSFQIAFALASNNQPVTTPDKETCDSQTQERRARFLSAMRACHGKRMAHTKKKVVALTFDDGPNKKYTEEILEILRLHDIKGTFFFIGKNIEEYPEMVKEAYRDGNIICNHTYSHHYLPKLTGEELEEEFTKTNQLIHKIIGVTPALFRPPYGACSNRSRRVAKNLGLTPILWSSMVDDYKVPGNTPDKIAAGIIDLVEPGAIIGLHDGGGNRAKTVDALSIIITTLKKEGYHFLTVPELLNISPYAVSTKKKLLPRVRNHPRTHL